MNQDFTAETAAIGHMDAVPMILDIVCRTTGMGFAAVAHVTEDRWIACSVLDRIQFGLAAGGELKVETTICHRIRETGEAVLIDDTETHPFYRHHPTPSLYGFRSYVSMPIIRADGSFFGTLCAIDPHARKINTPEIRSMFKAFAALIASHLAQSREGARGGTLECRPTRDIHRGSWARFAQPDRRHRSRHPPAPPATA
jgi:GAF domain-containing protein